MPSLSVFQASAFAPFNEYPITKPFKDRRLPPASPRGDADSHFSTATQVFISSLAVLALLAAFNIVYQGTVPTSTSILLPNYVIGGQIDGVNTECQPALLKVGDSLFTASPNVTAQNATSRNPGSFKWSVNSLISANGEPTAISVPYHGEALSCNMSSWGLTYQLMAQSFNYGMCGNCKAINPKSDRTFASSVGGGIDSMTLNLCSNFDLNVDNWPKFTSKVQDQISAHAFYLTKVYQNLTFAPGALPDIVYPPYNGTVHNPLSDRAIIPYDCQHISAWMGGFEYVPRVPGLPPKACAPGKDCAQGDFVVDNVTFNDTPPVFNATGWHSGVALAISGMGNLMPAFANNGDVDLLPGVLPSMFNYTYGVASFMLDTAAADLNERSLAVTYLCTLTKRQWKAPITLLAVVLGNSLGLTGAALAFLIFLGRWYDRSSRFSKLNNDNGTATTELMAVPTRGYVELPKPVMERSQTDVSSWTMDDDSDKGVTGLNWHTTYDDPYPSRMVVEDESTRSRNKNLDNSNGV